MLPLVAKLPNLAMVDRKYLADGQNLDTEEFTAAGEVLLPQSGRRPGRRPRRDLLDGRGQRHRL
jgi:hypothetical protein